MTHERRRPLDDGLARRASRASLLGRRAPRTVYPRLRHDRARECRNGDAASRFAREVLSLQLKLLGLTPAAAIQTILMLLGRDITTIPYAA